MASIAYSSLFHTLYDEPSPVGHLGRGAHYSVLQAIQWAHPLDGEGMVFPLLQRLAVLWDEDHDTRVIDMIEVGYLHNLLYPVLFVGERKANLTVVVRDEFEITDAFTSLWDAAAESVGKVIGDYWNLEIVHFRDAARKAQVIHDKVDAVETYLRNITNVWQIGMHDHPRQNFGGPATLGKTLVEFV
jgi:hypothetical protein